MYAVQLAAVQAACLHAQQLTTTPFLQLAGDHINKVTIEAVPALLLQLA
jgi:hypothetical protein